MTSNRGEAPIAAELATAAEDRTAIWLPLLRELTATVPDWIAWKHVDSAFSGDGDIDSVAPGTDWDAIRTVVRRWAAERGLGPVVVCSHAPGLLHIVVLPANGRLLFELDVNRHKVFLGSTLFQPADLKPLTRMDPLGFRRLRPGAEGLLKLVQNGMYRGARVNREGMRDKKIVELLASDPDGVAIAAGLFGPARAAVQRGADATVRGGWDRRAMLAVEGWALLRGLTEPRHVAWRLLFRYRRRRCPVLVTVFRHRRRIPEAVDEWLARVTATDHEVYDDRLVARSDSDRA
jgi:hypothetical protein